MIHSFLKYQKNPSNIWRYWLMLFSPVWITAHAQQPFTCEDQFFLTLSTHPPSLNEVLINPQTLATTFVSINDNLSLNVNAAGFRSTDNFIYCIEPDQRLLVRLDANGSAQVLANLPLNPSHAYFAGDITPDGRYLILIGTAVLNTGQILAADLVRVDLEDPNYGVTIKPIGTPAVIFDIAFHPVTDVLYGYDSSNRRLVQINPNTGQISYPYPPSGGPYATGSLFFDAYGNLFAYGSPTMMGEQNSFYELDTGSGAARLVTTGDVAEASDGCSCPYTIELSKNVSPRSSLACSEVDYTFKIVNTTDRTQTDIVLEDQLPPGFSYVSVVSNPLGGTVTSMPGDAVFRLENIDLPEGIFEVVVRVNTGNVTPGTYRNQAVLSNLPVALGTDRHSDDPITLILDDSTSLQIVAQPFDTVYKELALCEGVTNLSLDGQSLANLIPGQVNYLWQNGATTSSIAITQPGMYELKLLAGCDTAWVFYDVVYSAISADITTQDQTIALGDSLFLTTIYENTDDPITFNWRDEQGNSLACPTCPDTWARPFNDIVYLLEAKNALGCTAYDSVRISLEKTRKLYFPNVFKPGTPNYENAWFYGSGDQYANLTVFSIYSRWGELLYEARNISLNDVRAGWDGTTRGRDALPGVYVWMAKVKWLDGLEQVFAGDVTLIR